MRLCANTGAQLHLIHPLGFALDDKRLRRAGLDYREWVKAREYPDWVEFTVQAQPSRLFALSTRGRRCYTDVLYRAGDAFLLGPETRGLPADILSTLPEAQRLYIPMLPDSRSLNLSNAAAVVIYEAWRQLGFSGAHNR